jgi:hypothetical protein
VVSNTPIPMVMTSLNSILVVTLMFVDGIMVPDYPLVPTTLNPVSINTPIFVDEKATLTHNTHSASPGGDPNVGSLSHIGLQIISFMSITFTAPRHSVRLKVKGLAGLDYFFYVHYFYCT